MRFTSGNYMNLTDLGWDIFVILNEPNPAPTMSEYDTLSHIVEATVKEHASCGAECLKNILMEKIEFSGCCCVGYGVQLIVHDLKADVIV